MRIESTEYEYSKRYLLEISYDGTAYGGWQIQPHCMTVQQVLQERLTKLFNKQPIHVIGSSRTDAGVHALGFMASFLVPVRPEIPIERLFKALNRQLPPDIKIISIKEVPLEFHTRYDAIGKAYTYVINQGNETPFLDRYTWKPIRKLDVEKIRQAAAMLIGTHDYSSFVVQRNNIDDAIRTIFKIDVQEFGPLCCITFVGNGFLYKMIRCLMGTLEAAGAGILTPEDVRNILLAKDRTQAPDTAPGKGLFLMKVFYDESENIFNWQLPNVPFWMS